MHQDTCILQDTCRRLGPAAPQSGLLVGGATRRYPRFVPSGPRVGVLPVKRYRGEPGHTRDTRTRRTSQPSQPTNAPERPRDDRISGRRRPTQPPQPRSRPLRYCTGTVPVIHKLSHASRHSRERDDGGPHVYQATCCDPATMPTRTSHADQVLLAHGPKCASVRAVEDAQRDIWFTQFKQWYPSPGQLLVCSWQVRRAMGSGSAPRG